jgi:outer membrane lipoprotein-sorting protein
MRLATSFLLTLLCLRADTLPEILARMNADSATFKGLTANLHRSEYNGPPLNETTESDGTLTVKKDKNRIAALLDFLTSKADPKQLLFRDNQYQEYLPKLEIVNDYDLGKASNLVSQFVTLAFGSKGSDLEKNYTMTAGGAETLSIAGESIKTTRLELVPRSDEARKIMAKVEYWVPEGKSYAVKLKFYAPRGDSNTVTYSNIQINPPGDHPVQLSAPKNVKHERIDK